MINAKCWTFLEWVGPRILSLECIDNFGTCEYFSGWKKKNLYVQNFDYETNSTGQFIFSDDWNDT